MRLTITGADAPFAREVIRSYARVHTIRGVDLQFAASLPAGVEAIAGDVRDRDFAREVTRGADAVLHLAPLSTQAMNDAAVVDTFSRGSFNLVDTAIDQGTRFFMAASSLQMFDRLPSSWRIDENWQPRPEPIPEHLACWLSELSLRECCRTAAIRALCLRFGRIVTDDEASGAFDPRQLHIADAVQAVGCALRQFETLPERGEWHIYHISCGERARVRPGNALSEAFGFRPEYTFDDRITTPEMERDPGREWRSLLRVPSPPVPPRQKTHERPRVVIFGSGGPVAAALAEELQHDFTVRQTDLRSLEAIRAENAPQSAGAPLPAALAAPHEEKQVDVRDPEQVLDACRDMDIIINCTVVRPDHVEAFRVNTLGAYNVMRAAVHHGIRRIVHTGPQQLVMDPRTGYHWDYDVPGNAPGRPGRNLYAHSKFLGNEICRLFAANYSLEAPNLVYAQFLNPEVTHDVWTMAVSWKDSARALRRAMEVERLPSGYEEIVITNDLPAGRFSAQRARELLGWEAEDDLSALWRRRDG